MDRAERASLQWQKERPGTELEPMVILGRLMEATNRISEDHIAPVFRQNGLKAGEFDVLATLRRSGEPYALTPTQLYRAMMISSGGMTARLDRLEKAGLVRRRPHPQDRRGVLIELTGDGYALIDRMLPDYLEVQKAVVSSLEPAERAELARLLGRLIEGVSFEG